MNIRQLYYFRQIAKCENMTTAANELYIAQSALSIALANLEKNLGVKLFEREKGRLLLNDYGRILLRYADPILQNYDQALAEIEARKNQDKNSLRIGIIDPYYFKNVILSFIDSHPEVNIIQSTISPHALQPGHSLNTGYDFIIAPLPPDYQGLDYDIIAEDEPCLLVSCDHPLAAKGSATLSDINNEDLIIPGSGYSLHDFILYLLDAEGIHPRSIKECVIPIIHDMVIERSGLAIVVGNMLHLDLNTSGLCQLPLKTSIKRQKALLYSSESSLSPIQKSFREHVITYFRESAQPNP